MSAERYRLLGLATPRAAWFRDLSRWATNAALPVEFVKCVALEELPRPVGLGSGVLGGRWSMPVWPALDRDLVDARPRGRRRGHRGRRRPRPPRLGLARRRCGAARAVRPGSAARRADRGRPAGPRPRARGRLHGRPRPGRAGAGGWSPSPVPAVAARRRWPWPWPRASPRRPRQAGHGAAGRPRPPRRPGLLHDAGDVVPGVQELVEAHRAGTPTIDEVRRLAFDVDGPRLRPAARPAPPPGLDRAAASGRRRPRSTACQRSYRLVVADVDPDVEGDDEVGSVDVEDRNVLARTAPPGPTWSSWWRRPRRRAAAPGRDPRRLHRVGVDPDRMLPVITRAPRRAMARAEIAGAIAALAATSARRVVGSQGRSAPRVRRRPARPRPARAAPAWPLPRAIVTPDHRRGRGRCSTASRCVPARRRPPGPRWPSRRGRSARGPSTRRPGEPAPARCGPSPDRTGAIRCR